MDVDLANRIIREFCSRESNDLLADGRKRRSILLQIMKDLDYNLGVHKSFRELELSPSQQSKLDSEIAPLIVPPLLLSSAIDSLARVLTSGRRPTANRSMFIDSAKRLFGLDDKDAAMMWKLRNSLSHAYSLKGYSFVRHGGGAFGNSVGHVIATRPMRSMLQQASAKLESILLDLPDSEKFEVCKYLEEHGFIYYLAEDDANSSKSGEDSSTY